ncbi:uncharacterized protein PHACADRAFT_263369 [Phanerochaete carnosa HHB-10118-sp]|uniref:Uncharacterized protein n=1 Tax=Phanerochaete carnosa (strain HHB-10118-sp) TaxID=650164 RepID=K5VJ46_PHACS|nr:uncharacterized protein PHACADRAFT_263369 [Phanerochaete carnosa HHB-10118-sp]EKM51318.1 hypothetical protein PHACADRAFT_263369 [Phanerochaete carnosa HHB-10118-sp]
MVANCELPEKAVRQFISVEALRNSVPLGNFEKVEHHDLPPPKPDAVKSRRRRK